MPESLDINIHYIGSNKPWALYLPTESFRTWRRAYSKTVSRIPFYILRPSYWLLTAGKIRRKILGW